jgi:hypothetical protein
MTEHRKIRILKTMKSLIFNKIKTWVLRFLQIQLFITLFSMPILLAWGLPISLLSPVGNMVSGPFLMAFLLLSSFVFFTELLHIPNDWIIWLLEKTTTYWLKFLQSASLHRWTYGFAQPPTWLLIACICITILIMYHRKTRALYTSIACFLSLFSILSAYSYLAATTPSGITTLPCNRGELTFIHNAGNMIIIDPGVLGQRISAPSWAQYTLMPHIIKTTGKMTIDHLILLKPGTMLFQAAERLCTKMNIKNIYLAAWNGALSLPAEKSFNALLETCRHHKCAITLVNHPINITLSDTNSVQIMPLAKQIKKDSAHYPVLAVNAQIDKEKITIYPAKYINKITK